MELITLVGISLVGIAFIGLIFMVFKYFKAKRQIKELYGESLPYQQPQKQFRSFKDLQAERLKPVEKNVNTLPMPEEKRVYSQDEVLKEELERTYMKLLDACELVRSAHSKLS